MLPDIMATVALCVVLLFVSTLQIIMKIADKKRTKNDKRVGTLYIDYSIPNDDPDIYIQLYEPLEDIQNKSEITVTIKLIGEPIDS